MSSPPPAIENQVTDHDSTKEGEAIFKGEEHRDKMEKIEREDAVKLQSYRIKSFWFTWGLVFVWALFVIVVVFLHGKGCLKIEPLPLATLFGSTTATIVGVLYIMMRYIFPSGLRTENEK